MGAAVRIYQGNQIGGCITVISTERTKIVIDFGESLPGTKQVDAVQFDWNKENVDAVFFTHYHGDHMGRFMEVPDDVDMYMGEVTFQVMLNIQKARKDEEAKAVEEKLLKRLENGTILFVERNVPISINDDVVVTGYEVDHSAFDACMYLIEANGITILHTGDFRDHGHRGHVIKNGIDHNIVLEVIERYILKNRRRKVDVLVIEGTMLGERANDERFSEKQLMAWAKAYFEKQKYVFLKISSTNVDSLASFYQAAKANGMTMYASRYVINQLHVYRTAGRKHGTHMYDFYNVKPIPFLSDRKGADNSRAYETLDEMRRTGFVMLVSEYDHYERVMDALADVHPEMIYSMWEGYRNSEKPAYNKTLADFCQKYHAFLKHTSGHAYPELIRQVITLVNPTHMILPIHTENAEGFRELDIPEELKRKIQTVC